MFRLLARGSSFTCVFLSVLPPSYFDWFLVSFYHATTGYSILAGATELTAITCILEQDRAVVFSPAMRNVSASHRIVFYKLISGQERLAETDNRYINCFPHELHCGHWTALGTGENMK